MTTTTTTTTPRRLPMRASPRRIRERLAIARLPVAPPPARIPAPSAMSRYLVARLREDPPDDPAFTFDLRCALLRYCALDFGILEVRPDGVSQ